MNYISIFGQRDAHPNELKTVKTSQEIETPWEHLPEYFLHYGHSPQLFKSTGRGKEYGLGMPSLIFMDIDDTHPLTFALEAFKGYKHIIYTSRNHQKTKKTHLKNKPPCDRYRVVLALASPIDEDENWRATIKWIENETGVISDPALHFWSFFYPGKEIISNNPDGALIYPKTPASLYAEHHGEATQITQATQNTEPGESVPLLPDPTHWTNFYIQGKGVLTKATRGFLLNAAPDGQFNQSLFIAAADAKDQGYTQEEFKNLYLKFTPKCHQKDNLLDETDLATVKSAYNRATNPRVFRAPPTDKNSPHHKHSGQKNEPTPESLQKIIKVISKKFLIDAKAEESIRYEIMNEELKEVRVVQNEDLWQRYFKKESKKEENFVEFANGSKGPLPMPNWESIYRLDTPSMEKEVESFLMPDEDGYTLKKLTFKFEPGETPAWTEFVSRLSDPSAFCQWVGSCFDRENKGRQALWLYGPKGRDGKSTIITTLAKIFGESTAALNENQIRGESRFMFSMLYKKRFVAYPDCKIPHWVTSELFRNMTSDDMVPIEFKGQHPFYTNLHVKLIIGSNFKPAPRKVGDADISRLVMIEVAPSKIKDDPKWKKELAKELGHFLYDCVQEYQSRVKEKELDNIEISKETEEALIDTADNTEENYEAICDLILFDENLPAESCVTAGEFVRWYSDKCQSYGLNKNDQKRLKDYLESQKGVKIVKTRLYTGERVRVYKGIRELKTFLPEKPFVKPKNLNQKAMEELFLK